VRKDGRFYIDMRDQISKEWLSVSSFSYSKSDQGDLNSVARTGMAALNYTPGPDFAASAGMHGDSSATRQLTTRNIGVDGTARYQKPFASGVAQISYGAHYDQREQASAAAQTNIIGEHVTLTGTAYLSLAHSHVVAGSVVVSNNTRSQSYLEGRDYTLTLVGVDTRLQRLVAGSILDGQDLLVDYSYQTGGTFAYTQADQSLSFSWGLRNILNVYARYLDAQPRLTSGEPTFTLNTVRSALYGAHTDLPLRLRVEMMLGGSLEHEDRRETISPFVRQSADMYLQSEEPFFGSGSIRASARRLRVEYQYSPQGVNLRGYDLTYSARFPYGVEFSTNATYEVDNGALVERRRLVESAKAQWRYRKLSLNAEIGRSIETQGDYKRSRAFVQMTARREF
jgi:hypothetical protein